MLLRKNLGLPTQLPAQLPEEFMALGNQITQANCSCSWTVAFLTISFNTSAWKVELNYLERCLSWAVRKRWWLHVHGPAEAHQSFGSWQLVLCCEIMFKAWKICRNINVPRALFDFSAEWFLFCVSLKGLLKSQLCPGLQRMWIQLPWVNLGLTFRKVLNFHSWQSLLLNSIFINKLEGECIIPEYKGTDFYIFPEERPVRNVTHVSPLQQWFGAISGPKRFKRLFVMIFLVLEMVKCHKNIKRGWLLLLQPNFLAIPSLLPAKELQHCSAGILGLFRRVLKSQVR